MLVDDNMAGRYALADRRQREALQGKVGPLETHHPPGGALQPAILLYN